MAHARMPDGKNGRMILPAGHVVESPYPQSILNPTPQNIRARLITVLDKIQETKRSMHAVLKVELSRGCVEELRRRPLDLPDRVQEPVTPPLTRRGVRFTLRDLRPPNGVPCASFSFRGPHVAKLFCGAPVVALQGRFHGFKRLIHPPFLAEDAGQFYKVAIAPEPPSASDRGRKRPELADPYLGDVT
jgi:hypothetical protein